MRTETNSPLPASRYNHAMEIDPQLETYAAVDLGSNSFHLLVARREHGELRVLDRIKEMVRLGGGLDQDGHLDPEVQQRALDCLSRFGQRLRGIPEQNRRAVGTQTFRRLKHADEFLQTAENALECPVDIIAGREEARLIYLGVTQWVAGRQQKQLVMDIGGGSTELIIGDGIKPLMLESLQFGCVSVTNRFFADGIITEKSLKKAQRAVASELQELQNVYRNAGWKVAIGSSGTILSAALICETNGWGKKGITPKALEKLKRKALSFGTVSELQIDGLIESRQPVFIGGLAIMLACFEALNIKKLVVSPYALREGLLQDQLGRLEHRDPRDKAVKALMSRFAVDTAQVRRVLRTALQLFDQLSSDNELHESQRVMLAWAAELHEIGLSLSHTSYQQHLPTWLKHLTWRGSPARNNTSWPNCFGSNDALYHPTSPPCYPDGYTERSPSACCAYVWPGFFAEPAKMKPFRNLRSALTLTWCAWFFQATGWTTIP